MGFVSAFCLVRHGSRIPSMWENLKLCHMRPESAHRNRGEEMMRPFLLLGTVLGFLVVGLPIGHARAECPIGSYPWVDNWGNRVCKSFDTGHNTTTEGSLSKC